MYIDEPIYMCRTRNHFSLFGIISSFLLSAFPSLLITNIAPTWQVAFFGPVIAFLIAWTLLLILSIYLDRKDIAEARIEQAHQAGIEEERQRRIRFEMQMAAEEVQAKKEADTRRVQAQRKAEERAALVAEIYEQVRAELEIEQSLARYNESVESQPVVTIGTAESKSEPEPKPEPEPEPDPFKARWNLDI